MWPEIDTGVIEFNRSKAQAHACMNFRKEKVADVLANTLAAVRHRRHHAAAVACHSGHQGGIARDKKADDGVCGNRDAGGEKVADANRQDQRHTRSSLPVAAERVIASKVRTFKEISSRPIG
jgi:hypothetical protein